MIRIKISSAGANTMLGGQWLSGRVLDSRPRGCGFEPHRRHCDVSLSKNINPSLVLVQPRKTRPFITERLLMGCKESNQINNQTNQTLFFYRVIRQKDEPFGGIQLIVCGDFLQLPPVTKGEEKRKFCFQVKSYTFKLG